MNKVLIVEDERMTAMVVQEALKIQGIESEIADDGEKGINLIKGNEYDLILLD